MGWREDWARDLTPEQRSNLRSWGVDCPEPPAPPKSVPANDPREIGRNLEAIARGETKLDYSALYGADTLRYAAEQARVVAKMAQVPTKSFIVGPVPCIKCGNQLAENGSNYCALHMPRNEPDIDDLTR